MKYIFGVDIGGTSIKFGLFSEVGELLETWNIPTNSGDSLLSDVANAIAEKLTEKNVSKGNVIGIGIGVPGPVTDDGVVVVGVNIGWPEPVDAKIKLEKLLGLPTFLANDANVAALAELWQGTARECKNALMFTLGTGVGGGIIVDGKIIHGSHGAGGEVGHFKVVPDGYQCNCGGNGCLETVTSATGIVRETKEYLEVNGDATTLRELTEISAKDIFEAAKNNDRVAQKMVNQVGYHLGLAAANLAVGLDPEKIIIGGGVSKAGDVLINAVKKHYREFAFPPMKNTEITIAKLGNDAGIIGAAYLAISNEQ